jgi:hypothetical protein
VTQPPQSGSLEQVLRMLKAMALSNAFTVEMDLVAAYMGADAFTPAPIVDATGQQYTIGLIDTQFGDPAEWVPMAFKKVRITQQLRPVPPYPHLELLGAPGRIMRSDQAAASFELDTGEMAGWSYAIDAVVVAQADRPEIASRRALAMCQGFERLVRRNEHLGGLVELIASDGPPAPGGEVERGRIGLISGVAQRFHVAVKAGLL